MADDAQSTGPKWTQIEAIDRRVLGVLVEKAKTTPDAYPLTLRSLVTGANQKSNRFPQMTVDEEQVADSLDRLRTFGAVMFIQGDGRTEKYRHLAYDWLGVDKVELAVMAELLLRGAQTVGELRGRAARMEPIKGLSELQPLLESLHQKSLLVYLSPPGRGAVVTHNLYLPRELEKVQREHGTATAAPAAATPATATAPPAAPAAAPATPPPATPENDQLDRLRSEVADLRAALTSLREEAEASIASLQDQMADLNRQLGN